MITDQFRVGNHVFSSRLLVGTGKFGSFDTMKASIEASQADIVTVALRRADMGSTTGNILDYVWI